MDSFAAQTLIDQINKKWPERNKSADFVSYEKITFHPDLTNKELDINKNKKDTEDQVFANQLIDFVKNDKDKGRIEKIIFKGKVASKELKNKFWVWQDQEEIKDNFFHIYFSEKNRNNGTRFNVPVLRISPLRRPTITKINHNFPGMNVVQYGKRNKSVKKMQNRLISKGYKIDHFEIGYYGQQTCDAVKEFYKKELKVSNGNVVKEGKTFGPKAWERLFEDALGN